MPGTVEKKVVDGGLKHVLLVCYFCSGSTTINVPVDRSVPERMYWECMECQKDAREKKPTVRGEKW